MWFVYILECRGYSLYTGITNDISKRIRQHRAGRGGAYTRSHLPVIIVYAEQLPSKSEALKREAEIKSWSRTEKIHNLNLPIKNHPGFPG